MIIMVEICNIAILLYTRAEILKQNTQTYLYSLTPSRRCAISYFIYITDLLNLLNVRYQGQGCLVDQTFLLRSLDYDCTVGETIAQCRKIHNNSANTWGLTYVRLDVKSTMTHTTHHHIRIITLRVHCPRAQSSRNVCCRVFAQNHARA